MTKRWLCSVLALIVLVHLRGYARAQAQNALNTPQFGEPVGTLTDANFGRIITGGGERRLQLGVRFGF